VDVATVHGDNTTSSAINTQVLGLKVGNAHIPVPIPQNFHVTIPGIVNVVLNAAFSVGDNTTGSLMTEGAGFYISLLKGVGTSPVGTEVFINPVYAAIATVSPQTGPVVGGNAYGSQITVVAGKLLNIYSGPTAQVGIPPYGTNGVTITNTTATATIPSILTLGVLTDKANGLKGPTGGFSQATTQTSLAHLNLLGGLITADALTGTAHVETTANGTSTVASTSTSIVNLVIAGHAIPVNVAPNTVINLASLGQITIRKQVQSANTAAVTLLEIKVTVAQGNIPVGALIQIGYASAEVFIP
jgi:hypothetical protein